MNQYAFPCRPIANLASCVCGPQYRFTLLESGVLRYEWSSDGIFEDRASTFAINRDFSAPDFRVEDAENQLDIITSAFHLTYDKQRFSANGFRISFTSKLTDWGKEWRYGTPAEDNLGGTARTVDEVDGRCDMGSGIISRAGYSTLDDSESMLFDGNGFVASRRPGDRIDGYLFAYGLDFKGAMNSFYAISGSQPPVPRWCLGNWWSRYHAYDDAEYLALMERFRKNEIPLSVAVVDMDWHIVKGDQVPHSGWTGYTWNKELFPDPERFTQTLHEKGLRVTLNDHPHAGVHCHEDMYQEMAAAVGHDTAHQTPILFDATSTKYMHAYLNTLHRGLEKQGCDFWWIDWQQGSYSRIPGIDPLWLLNHFQYLDTAHNKGESQALVFSRYAGPGSHRYPIGFSGDSVATWDSLKFQPEFTATASNIGYGWWSHDIGGHWGGVRSDECLVRWIQSGVFSPIFRLHSTHSRWMSKEPWLYRTESTGIMRDFMQLRHRLVPFIYSTMKHKAFSKLPLVQPLYWNFPAMDSSYKFPTQYYFGPSLVVSPILEPRDITTNLAKARVWVPPGRHVDIFTSCVYDGDQEIDMYRSLDRIPVLAAEGSIIPMDNTKVLPNGCQNPESIEILVVVGSDGHFTFIEAGEDDKHPSSGTKFERSMLVEWDQAAGQLKFAGLEREWKVRFISTVIDPASVRVFVEGSASDKAQCSLEKVGLVPSTVVSIPRLSKSECEIVVELGPGPLLANTSHLEAINDLLLDYQVPPSTKNDIWAIVQGTPSATIKVAKLISLGIDSNWLGPVAELLLADSRERH